MIKVTDKYYLDSDKYQFIVLEERKTKKGGKRYAPVAFCGNLFQVKNWIMNEEVRSDLEMLKNIDMCVRLSNSIDKTLTGVGKK